MAIVAFWIALVFFVGCLASVWWILLVDHGDLKEEPYEDDAAQDNPLAGADGVSTTSHTFESIRFSHIAVWSVRMKRDAATPLRRE